eukprot:11966151-Alexandrium_andersonii.AAC.1
MPKPAAAAAAAALFSCSTLSERAAHAHRPTHLAARPPRVVLFRRACQPRGRYTCATGVGGSS